MKIYNLDLYKGYISQNICDCLIFLNAKGILDHLIICGSLGLVLNRFLDREVHDIDFLTIPDWYGDGCSPLANYRDFNSGEHVSHRFEVDDKQITCWKIRLFDTKIDLLHNSTQLQTTFEEVELIVQGIPMTVKMEDPTVAVSFKERYVLNDKSEESREKHRQDLGLSPDTFTDLEKFCANKEDSINDLPF